ncbi:hypothetical protein H310_14370, partial [Aphanomyces invadans]
MLATIHSVDVALELWCWSYTLLGANDLHWPSLNRMGFADFFIDLIKVKLLTIQNHTFSLLM